MNLKRGMIFTSCEKDEEEYELVRCFDPYGWDCRKLNSNEMIAKSLTRIRYDELNICETFRNLVEKEKNNL